MCRFESRVYQTPAGIVSMVYTGMIQRTGTTHTNRKRITAAMPGVSAGRAAVWCPWLRE
jgi:hypothetical protein